MNQLGGGAPLLDEMVPVRSVPTRARPWTPAAAALQRLAGCLDRAAAGARAAEFADPAYAVGMPAVERCRVQLDGDPFASFAVAYGERLRAAVAAILDREERLARRRGGRLDSLSGRDLYR